MAQHSSLTAMPGADAQAREMKRQKTESGVQAGSNHDRARRCHCEVNDKGFDDDKARYHGSYHTYQSTPNARADGFGGAWRATEGSAFYRRQF
jgi:hypothetical protein